MSNTALRRLLDGLVSRGMERVFVLHDFDASGFSIFGTLGTDSRRYTFANHVNVVDLGLRLADVRDMGLSYEEYAPAYWDSRLETLERHGASQLEITILENHRVELNAMPSDVFVRFLEQKLVEHGVKKVVPDDDALTAHARNVMERALTNKALGDLRAKAHAAAHLVHLPGNLKWQVQQALEAAPERPWDLVTAEIATDTMSDAAAAAEWDAWAASVASDLDEALSPL
jgi:hypothetical protein